MKSNFSLFPLKHKIEQKKYCSGGGNDNGNIEFSSIYCLKALGAFFVICIHCLAPWFFFSIIRTAVPFFFIISGFFAYRENHEEAYYKCLNTLKKILYITLYANIFYYLCFEFPINVFPFKNIKSIIRFITIGDSFGSHLWYLNAFLEALLVIIISLKLRVIHYLWCCIPFFILIGLCTGKYEFLFPYFPNNLVLSRNFITIGIPCFGIGWLLKKYSKELIKILKFPILLTLGLLLLSLLEIFLLKYSNHFLAGDYLITTFPLAGSMVLLAAKYPKIGKNSIIEYTGKKYSLYIYIFHVFIMKIFILLNKGIIELSSFTIPFIIFVLTILFTIIWKKCSIKFF